MALRMATSEATCEYVCPETRPLVTDQLEELRSGGAIARDFTTTSLTTRSSQQLNRNISFVTTFLHDDHKPQYKTVLDGQGDQKEMDNLPYVSSSVPTNEGYAMHMTAQDSDDIDGDFTILSHQPSGLNYQPCDSHPNVEVNEVVTPIDGEDKVVNITNIEEGHQEVDDISVVTVAPVECEDKSIKSVVVLLPSKTAQNTIDPEPLKQKQQDEAEVLYRSNKWQAEFSLGEMVVVKPNEIEYHHTYTIKGCSRTLVYKRVKPIDHQVFKKWERLDNVHCNYVVAYLEDGIFGYIIKELLENEMVKVVRMIDNLLKTTEEDIAKLDMCKYPTAMEMSQWNGRRKELQRLKQLLRDLVMGVNNACDCLHQLGFVSLNLESEFTNLLRKCKKGGSPPAMH